LVSTILIVDDDPTFLALAARLLEGTGIEVVAQAQDAASAIEAAAATRPDAALVDAGLPDRNGIDLAYELAALPWEPRVVVTSTDADVGAAIDARPGDPKLPFIAKEDLTGRTLVALLSGD
jgi:two-component system, OmpR family, KDP operon response regulator KdpE